jgi:1,4-dihydroxy-2-naphthoyl-CoA synthase
MDYQNILYEKRGPIAYVTLNRPDKLNALSDDLQLEMRHALEDAGWEDEDIRVIVLKAAGRQCGPASGSVSQRQNFQRIGLVGCVLEQSEADHCPDSWFLHCRWPRDRDFLRSSHLLGRR